MNTPICSFLKKYASDDNLRLHMPGHKGLGQVEKYDLTEIDGADSLYEASGIILESEENASHLFGSYTLYSTEGSSLAIRAMLYLAMLRRHEDGRPIILAGRNAHKVFVSAAALLDFDIEWLCGTSSYLSCNFTPEDVEKRILEMPRRPLAVYITSPDYLGNVADIKGISEVCKRLGVLLLVDNAHGAYLAFTTPNMHPISLGADMCADSAHKTLPCLTGAAYLHLAESIPESIRQRAKSALALFGSTSPSYLILASLDKANSYLSNGYREKLLGLTEKLKKLKSKLCEAGYEILGNEPMKLTVLPKSYGYTGYQIADVLKKNMIVPEFSDPDHIVLMITPEITDSELERVVHVLTVLPKKEKIFSSPPKLSLPERSMSPREAILKEAKKTDVRESLGHVLADITVGCPPAVPIVVSGEIINEDAIRAFEYYGIDTCSVLK